MKNFNPDDLSKVLPEVPGIMRKDEYFNSAVMVPFIKVGNSYHLLFQKRSAHIRQGSEICFPGGEYDPDKDNTLEETAIRETIEELGISREQIKILGKLDVMVGTMGITIDPIIAELLIDSLDDLKIDTNEVEKVFTVPVSFFIDNPPEEYFLKAEIHPFYTDEKGEQVELFPVKELDLPIRYHKPWGMQKHKVFAWRTSGGTIWGMTAVLIRETIRLINQL